VVLAVGNNTNQGKAGLSMNIESDQTPLQKKLDRIAEGIGLLGMAVAIMTFIAIVISTLIITFKDDEKEFDMTFVTAICNGLVIAITVVVVAVPEGLPLAVTISLAYSVGKMYDENNLVRKLHSSETMGNANEICSDKTGTLTQNKMTVMTLYAEDRVIDGEANPDFMQMASHDDVMRAVIYNSTAKIAKNPETGDEETTGNATEVGLIKYLTACGAPTREMIADRTDRGEPVAKVDFSSQRKRSTTCIYTNNEQTVRVYCKGAPDMVIKNCVKMVGPNGELVTLEDAKKKEILRDVVAAFAHKCLRTILVAYCDIDRAEFERIKAGANDFATNDDKDILEQDMVFGALFGIKDPLREGIYDAVKTCHNAGINVRMVTGDWGITAKAISLEAGIIT
jgi:Ca2+ transporting ATPase